MTIIVGTKFHAKQTILHIQISLDTKFQLKLIILIFRTKFALKEYFRSNSE